ncbi:DUF4956 domain-containing protein [Sedimentibacter sp.]|uniref:DUF4956 domain-containing protein n=1 Tax=Sedimentibacter sp. TaxID=1960295 RepID=UPI0028A23A0A|nr:DUF4956 domain-containing protein [Sedimentibacter sp.]
MLDSIFSVINTDLSFTTSSLLTALSAAFVLGLSISLVYMKTHKTHTPTQSFALTLVMLPMVITIIILLVGNNVARAFSLAGAFSIIRFRSAPGDPKDITYVLMCMAVGLAVGMGFITYAVITAVALCMAVIMLETVKFGRPRGTAKLLKITIPEALDYQDAFDDIMNKYTLSSTLYKVKTTDLGSLYELSYSVVTKNENSDKDFIDELRCRNGNMNITLVLAAQTGEF